MRRHFLGTTFLLSVSVFGCSSPTPPADAFTNVYNTIIAPTCTNDYCHYAGVGLRLGSLDMSSKVTAYWNLVDQPCQSPACASDGTRVIPFDPGDSIMYQKVLGTANCGVQMPASVEAASAPAPSPKFTGPPLGQDQQNLIENWISDGAQNN